jgi:alkanesulfonate monooxygenase SsuD/methylene tetrahydromethanopterin reductase-like flavin-dependent oxidoreductase (luciferase family)
VLKPELVASREEAHRVVAASLEPDEATLLQVAAAWSSDLETDLTRLPLDAPLTEGTFGDHVSRGTVRGLLGTEGRLGADTLRTLLARKARKGLLSERAGFVGTAEDLADLVEEMGEDADNDGFLLSGDLHPVTVHRMLDDLVRSCAAGACCAGSWATGACGRTSSTSEPPGAGRAGVDLPPLG